MSGYTSVTTGYTSVTTFVRGENAEVRINCGDEKSWFLVQVRDAEGNHFEVAFHCSSVAARDEMIKELGVAAIRA